MYGKEKHMSALNVMIVRHFCSQPLFYYHSHGRINNTHELSDNRQINELTNRCSSIVYLCNRLSSVSSWLSLLHACTNSHLQPVPTIGARADVCPRTVNTGC